MKIEQKIKNVTNEPKQGKKLMVFDKKNMILMVIATLFLIAGYIIMGTGDKTISPIILVVSYAVLFPIAILSGTFKKKDKQ